MDVRARACLVLSEAAAAAAFSAFVMQWRRPEPRACEIQGRACATAAAPFNRSTVRAGFLLWDVPRRLLHVPRVVGQPAYLREASWCSLVALASKSYALFATLDSASDLSVVCCSKGSYVCKGCYMRRVCTFV